MITATDIMMKPMMKWMKINYNFVHPMANQYLTTNKPMKRTALMLVLALAVTVAFGQKNVRQTASNYLKEGKLDKALEAINQCINDPTTSADAKTWFLRGNIFLEMSNSTNAAYKALDADPLKASLESYKKAIELDAKKEFYDDIIAKLNWQRNNYFNVAVDEYNKKNYKAAMLDFANGADVIAIANVSDTAALLNAAYCAALAGEPKMAKRYYEDLLKGGYNSPNLFVQLSDIYRQEKDESNAIRVINEGLKLYPDDLRLFLAETNIYLTFGNTEKALRNLNAAIEKDKSNPSVFFALGTIYDNISNDSAKTETVRKECFNNAIKAYQDAIALKPDYFEPNYNIGAMYVNSAAMINDEANKLPLDQTDKFNALKKQADGYLDMATPFLETASQLQPNDLNTLYSLKQIYARTGKMDKVKLINERIAKITQ
jgi:hypothetical protein